MDKVLTEFRAGLVCLTRYYRENINYKTIICYPGSLGPKSREYFSTECKFNNIYF